MEVVKKHLISIICGVVALAAVVFYFVGAKPKFAALAKQMSARVNKPQEATSLMQAARALPPVSDAPPVKLDRFPNQTTLDEVGKVVKSLSDESQKVVASAVQINSAGREQLFKDALPRPTPVQAFGFRDQYIEVLSRNGRPNPSVTNYINIPDGVLRSAEPPTDAEIKAAKDKLWFDTYAPQVVIQNGQPLNLKEVAADFLKATEKFDEEFRQKRARAYKVYLEPTALKLSPPIATKTAQAPLPADMWYAQMALWVQQDVCNAIAAMNAKHAEFKDIPSSPIKHIISVDVKPDQTMYVMKGGMSGQPMAMSVPPPPDGGDGSVAPAATVTGIDVKDYTLSPTGRICNVMYDVVHFNLVLVVDAEYVKPFLQQLQHGRFIGVLDMNVLTVDLDEALAEGYEYGRRPVVELRIKCEALFLRDWTAWVQQRRRDGSFDPPKQGPMPLNVQAILGIQPPPPPPSNGEGAVATQ